MTPVLVKAVSARQVVIDECAMATEPQTMIPLVCNRPEKVSDSTTSSSPTTLSERRVLLRVLWSLHSKYFPCAFQVVLIGDPKQLRPIVKNMRVKKLGMSRSLFERYFQLHNKRVVMLDTQYRMVNILSPPLSPPLSHVVLPSLISPPLSHVVHPSLTSSPLVSLCYRAVK